VLLILSVWAQIQNYADLDGQVRAMLGQSHDPLVETRDDLLTLSRGLLAPGSALQTVKGNGSLNKQPLLDLAGMAV
jgi:hypothetical protein